MFTKSIFAAGALLSMVAAVPLQQLDKRDVIYETKTFHEVVTVDVTTTVWLEPGETPPAHYGHGHGHGQGHGHGHKPQTTSTVPAAVPSSPAESSPASPYVPPTPSTPEAPAPTTSAYVPPTSQAPAPAPAPAPTPKSPDQGGSAGGSHTGEATYYTPGLGSCGMTNSESDMIVALAADMMEASMPASGNPNENPLCGKQITISYNGVTASATIVDTCPGCSGAGLDMTPTLFAKFANLSEGRLFGVTWSYA